MKDFKMEIARTLKQPIDPNLKVSLAIQRIADISFAEPGEEIKTYNALRTDVDAIINIPADGKIETKKKTVLNSVALTFVGLTSALQYVLATDVLSKTDIKAMANIKASLTRGMDKTELKRILDAILTAVACVEIPIPSSGDLYDTIMDAKHAVEDYADDYVLLCGSNVMNKIDTYDKDKAGTLNYNVRIRQMLKDVNIEPVKIFGKVDNTSADPNVDNSVVLLDANKFILVGRDSSLGDAGKPIVFCRRKLSGEWANYMGVDVDDVQRAVKIQDALVPDGAGNNVWGYGCMAFESIIEAILNPKSIVKSAELTSIL